MLSGEIGANVTAGDAPADLCFFSGTWQALRCSPSPANRGLLGSWPQGQPERWWEPGVLLGHPESISWAPGVCWGREEGLWPDPGGTPGSHRFASSATGFSVEATRPRYPTESRWPGVNPCTCHSCWHPIPGALPSSTAKLAWRKPVTWQTGTPRCPGGGSWAARGIVATCPIRSLVFQVPEGFSPLLGQCRLALAIVRLLPLARACGRSGELPARLFSLGHPLATPLPESSAAFQWERGAPVLTPSTTSSGKLVSSQELRSDARGWEQQAGHSGGSEGRLQHTFNSPIC